MNVNTIVARRQFLKSAAISSAVLVAGMPVRGLAAEENGKGIEDVSPMEALMREHGALSRILLIYQEALRRIQVKQELNPALISQSAGIVERFIHDYHEKLEEEYVFPPLIKARRHVDMVYVLVGQHIIGRELTHTALNLSTPAHFGNPSDLGLLGSALAQFIRMYRPHAAREDTMVFPTFKKVISSNEYHRLGDRFEGKEHELFGKEGFEEIVATIDRIEVELRINELSKFSPQL